MTRKKLKALTFADYIVNIIFSALGFIALSWLFNFSWGSFVYSIIFSFSLFAFMYLRGALAAKIDLREEKTPMSNAIKLALPLTITLILLITVYALILYNIIPVGDNIIKTAVSETGETSVFMVKNAVAIVIRILFLNITGFLSENLVNPILLLISPAIVLLGSCTGYYFGRRKIYLLDIFIKIKQAIADKFNE